MNGARPAPIPTPSSHPIPIDIDDRKPGKFDCWLYDSERLNDRYVFMYWYSSSRWGSFHSPAKEADERIFPENQ